MQFVIEYGVEKKSLPNSQGQMLLQDILIYTAYLVNDRGNKMPVFQAPAMNPQEFQARIRNIARHFENDPTVEISDLVTDPSRNGKALSGRLVIFAKEKEEQGGE